MMKAKRAKNPLLPVQNLSIVHDRTELPRSDQRRVRLQLQERIAVGETTLRIVTRNGQLKIVKDHRNITASTPMMTS